MSPDSETSVESQPLVFARAPAEALSTEQSEFQQPDTEAQTSVDRPPLLTSRDQRVIAMLCLVLLVWASVRWLNLTHWGQQSLQIERTAGREYAYVIDPNKANWLEFALLEGIGEVLGKKIVADREKNGPYTTVEDLRRVRGIGAKKLDKIRAQLQIQAPDSD